MSTNFDGDRYPKKNGTTIAIRVSIGICIFLSLFSFLANPSHGSRLERLLSSNNTGQTTVCATYANL